jgi:hypothetical protein
VLTTAMKRVSAPVRHFAWPTSFIASGPAAFTRPDCAPESPLPASTAEIHRALTALTGWGLIVRPSTRRSLEGVDRLILE